MDQTLARNFMIEYHSPKKLGFFSLNIGLKKVLNN